jgi:hypothetical protein
MDAKSLDEMFSDEYKPNAVTLATENSGAVSQGNCAKLAASANLLFDFLFSSPKKSAFYFVDWRIQYADLDEFLRTFDIYQLEPNERKSVFLFQGSYDISAGVLYERLGIVGDDRDYGPLIL